jgi:autotransporter-associated beta strand protein
VRLLNQHQIADTSRVTVNSSGLFAAASDTIAGLSGTGQVLLNGTLLVNIPSGTNSFDGTISGPGGLSKAGAGTLILTGINTYSGVTSLVAGGPLQVDGFQPASSVAVGGLARLQGSGTVGNITANGSSYVFAPGSSPGILTCSNFVITGSGTLQIELNGPSPGLGYDQLNVRGTVIISNLVLSASLNFRSSLSNQFLIINNDGSDAVSGTFNGKPEGSVFTIGAEQFRISYVGGDGNDVVLTQISGIFIPVLTIEKIAASTIRLLWHTNATGFNLESNTNLLTTNWLTTSPPPTIVGTNNVVTNTIIGPKKFYRLRKP